MKYSHPFLLNLKSLTLLRTVLSRLRTVLISDWSCTCSWNAAANVEILRVVITSNLMFCWPCIIVYQYSETNVLFNLLRIKGLYMFRALLAHPQEVLHKRHLVYCVRIMSTGCTGTEVEFRFHFNSRSMLSKVIWRFIYNILVLYLPFYHKIRPRL
jgi:hypothetical protein